MTPTIFLNAYATDIKVPDLQTELDKQWITNTLIHIRQESLCSQIMNINLSIDQLNDRTPTNLIQTPIYFGQKQNRYMTHYISARLLYNGVKIRNIEEIQNEEQQIALILEWPTLETLQSLTKATFKKKLFNKDYSMEKIRDATGTKLLSLGQILHNLKGTTNDLMKRDLEIWYNPLKEIVCETGSLNLKSEYLGPNNTNNRRTRNNNNTVRVEPKNTWIQEVLPITEDIEIQMWTDGSLDPTTGNMGAGVLILDKQEQLVRKNVQSQTTNGTHASSTRAELDAIYKGLTQIPDDRKVEIFSDSQNAITNIEHLKSGNLTERQIVKMNNHDIIDQIKIQMEDRNIQIEMTKVKAHSGIVSNEIADDLAKNSLHMDQETMNAMIKPKQRPKLFYLTKENVIVGKYPRKYIQEMFQNKQLEAFKEYFLKEHGRDDVKVMETLKTISKGLAERNFLDATETREQAFRVKWLSKLVPTMDNLLKWFRDQYTDNFCPRCKKAELETEEDQKHLITCPQLNIEEIIEDFKMNIQKNYDKKEWGKLKKKNPLNINDILNRLIPDEASYFQFTESAMAKGMITEEGLNVMKNIQNIDEIYLMDWTILTTTSWLQTIYHKIWKVRCKILHESNYYKTIFMNQETLEPEGEDMTEDHEEEEEEEEEMTETNKRKIIPMDDQDGRSRGKKMKRHSKRDRPNDEEDDELDGHKKRKETFSAVTECDRQL